MDKEQYQEWSSNPLTKQFFQFLMDYRQSIMEKWAVGELGDLEVEFKARAQQAFEFANLADDAIEEFYKNRKVEVKDAEQD